jgi:beta-mannosidase
MRNPKRFILVFLGLIFGYHTTSGEVTELLNSGWKLQTANGKWIPATIPGYVHTDLFHAGLIPDPFYGTNEQAVAWVAEKAWQYSLTFDVTTLMLKNYRVDLVFEGLDTYAEVWLNGKKILAANNQFREWSCDVKQLLKPKGNQLLVIFPPMKPIEDSLQKLYGLQLPGGNRVFTRKGQWQYGWDWAPSIVSIGIWRPVKLVGKGTVSLEHVHFRQTFENHKLKSLDAIFTLEVYKATAIRLSVQHPDIEVNQGSIRLDSGSHDIAIPLFFKSDVQYWWPAGMGAPHLYEFLCEVYGEGPEPLIQRTIRTGIREVELVQEPDLFGSSFSFRINGIKVFARGANWVPADHFPARVTQEHYKKLLDEATFANMNMLRVWGGGIYEDEEFYRLCDEKGIMVWQDFMFACAMYPGSAPMLANIHSEAEQQVQRLGNHPSVVLWCGNNEISEGWHRWGWPADYSKPDSARIWNDYLRIFGELLPQLVQELTPGIPYWPSSPSLGRGDPKHVFSGDSHYWGVWHDAEPFERFRNKIPRFMSEFGFQSYPMLSSVRQFTPDTALATNSSTMLVHQKHPRGNSLIGQYMKDWFPEPESFERYLYYSELMQAEGMAIGILAQRESKPWCMGSLYWQLNDCWPAVSWSSVDYYGERKAMHYKAREVLSPTIATVSVIGNIMELTVINDNPQLNEANVFLKIMDHKGKDLYSIYYPEFTLLYNENRKLKDTIPQEVAKAFAENKLFCKIVITAAADPELLLNYIILPDKPKNIPFLTPEIRYKIEKMGEDFRIIFWADAFVYGLYIEADGATGTFSNNFINLVPGELNGVIFTPDKPVDSLKIKYMHY